jgi:serine O-acetyltransferase
MNQDSRHQEIVARLLESYARHDEMSHLTGGCLPNREAVWDIVEDLLRILFPGYLDRSGMPKEQLAVLTRERLDSVERRLVSEIEKGLLLEGGLGCDAATMEARARAASVRLLEEIPAVREILATDIQAAYEGDPAARSLEVIIIAYPGLQAIAVYRLAHVLYRENIPLIPRVMTEHAHSRTGIDIHPGARIGTHFFIDHGTGVVIGETTTIGNHVKIYQGVTLGARSFPVGEDGRILKGHKRHPNIADRVTIYSGATILGDIHIGERSIVGGNVWLTHGIPADTKIIVRPAQQIHIDDGINDYQI